MIGLEVEMERRCIGSAFESLAPIVVLAAPSAGPALGEAMWAPVEFSRHCHL